MRKVTKILLMLLSATILLLIILPLVVSIALSLTTVQNYVVGKLTSFASNKIESRVDIGKVQFTLPHDFIFNDVLVEDRDGDTMIYSKVVQARISALSLLNNELIINHVKTRDLKFNLREMKDSMLNIKYAQMRISNPNSESKFRTLIEQIDIKNLDFSYTRLVSLKKEYGVDLSNIVINDIEGSVSDLEIHNRITSLTVNSFKGVEQSGLDIKSAKTNFVCYEGVLDFENFAAATNTSKINVPKLRMESDYWTDYKDFNSNVSIELLSNYSTLSAEDVAYFAPALEGKDFTARSLSLSANGTVEDLMLLIKNCTFGESSRLKGTMHLQGITDLNSAGFDVDIESLISSETDINNTMVGFGIAPLNPQAKSIIEKLGKIEVKGQIAGDVAKAKADIQALSDQGGATYKGAINNIFRNPQVNGVVETQNLHLGNILGNRSLGNINLRSDVEYAKLDDKVDAVVNGHILAAGYNSCTYSNIDFDAQYNGVTVESTILSHDPKLNFDLSALIRLVGQRKYDINMRVNNADMKALAINKKDSLSRISGSVKVNLTGNTIDNLNGQVTLRNINYQYNDSSVYAPIATMNARNNEKSKFLALESDFVDATFYSKSSYDALFSYLKEGLREYIPLLYTSGVQRKGNKGVTIADDYSTLSIKFKEFNDVAHAISEGLNIANNTSFNMMVNPLNERFSMRMKSDYLEHNNIAATDININASNDKDSLSLYATAADLFIGRSSLSSASLMAGARNNEVEISTGFRDSLASMSATLGMRMKFDGVQSANISLLPSQISMRDQMWMISARKITGNKSMFDIDNFTMVNGSQKLTLDGVISKNPSDSLTLKLNNYDIAMVTSVVNNFGYAIGGVSNGYVNIRELWGNPRVVADVRLDSVNVNSIPAPPLLLNAGWDTQGNRAKVVVSNRNNDATVATGYYAPSDNRYFAQLKVDSLNAGLIDPLLKSTISGTKGYANTDVTLRGQGKKASLNGTIDIYDISTKILFTQVDYSVPKARIEVKDNKLSTFSNKMYDKDGNQGLVTMNLSLDHLSNVSYNMRIVPENMLVLNTTEKDNELFYGKLYASGVATIKGDKKGVDMDITATSKPNSSFFMPLSTKSSVTKTDFIKFVQPNKEESEDTKRSNYRRAYLNERKRRLAQTSTQLNINMALQATPDLDFQLVIDPVVGDIIKAKGEGRLNLNIAPQSNTFEMYGDYSITEGNYLFTLLNVISKRFVIDSGSSIQWTGDPLDPLLNIDAVYKIKTSLDPLINGAAGSASVASDNSSASRAVPVDCIIHLGDRLAQPSVDFSIEVPTADTEQQAVIANTLIDQETISQQFFYLMIANSFIPVSTSYGSGIAGATTASTGFELLTNQLSNWLSSSNYNVVIRYRPESDMTSDEVDLGFSRGLIDNRLLIEVEGNYQADNKAAMSEENFSNFMGEAYVTWLIDKAGALRLKGFTQTIDRYDENQGLQETGIGVYYSESFNDIKDLKTKVVNRFRRKKKRK